MRKFILILLLSAAFTALPPATAAQQPGADTSPSSSRASSPCTSSNSRSERRPTRSGATATRSRPKWISSSPTAAIAGSALGRLFARAQDLTPQAFEIKGQHRAHRLDRRSRNHRRRQGSLPHPRQAERSPPRPPAPFFTIAGYAPTTMQMLMVRYWATHGSPAQLATLPSGTVKVEPRGQDTIHTRRRERRKARPLHHRRPDLGTRDALVRRESQSGRRRHHRRRVRPLRSHPRRLRKRAGRFRGTRRRRRHERAGRDFERQSPAAARSTIAIVGGTLIDGTGAAPVPDAAVVIHNGRIVAAGPRSKVKIPKHANVVDAHGKTILPGLWDMHAHFEQVEWGPIYLAAGVTTVRDCGNEFEFITAVRDAIAQGHGLGPRLLLAGIVDGTGTYTSASNASTRPSRRACGSTATTPPASSR